MRNFALIPARGGSKRIPGKNIKSFFRKPVIAYAIENALKSGLFDEVMVSTDDNEIASVAKKYGATVPFMRSQKNADDYATTASVVIEVLENYKARGQFFDNCCCIYPTTPLLNYNKIIEAYNKFITNKFDTVYSVLPFNYPIQRAQIFENGKIVLINPEYAQTRTQDIKPSYHDAGQFYWIQTEVFMDNKKLFTNNSSAIILNELEAQDIDNETDWKIAELKYKMLFGENK